MTKHLSLELRNLARLAAQWADVIDAEGARESGGAMERGSGALKSTETESYPAAANRSSAPVVFACALCGARTVWDVAGYDKPWPNALCKRCYAELRMRRDEIQDEALGYTGVR